MAALRLKKFREFLFDVKLKWYDIGIELEIKQEELDVIKRINHEDPSACLLKMIAGWLKSTTDEKKAWKTLADALNSKPVNEKALAAEGIYIFYSKIAINNNSLSY